MNTAKLYRRRRKQLLAQMGDGVAILPTAREASRNRDTHYPFRFDSYFYYLTGFAEPEAVVVLIKERKGRGRSLLFCRDKHAEREIWGGYRYGPAAAAQAFGFDAAYPIEQLDAELTKLLAGRDNVYFPLGADAAWDERLSGWLNAVRQDRAAAPPPTTVQDLHRLLDEMRVFKDEYELALMRRSAGIAAAAHRRVLGVTRPGMAEYEVEAELLHEFRRRGAQSPAYPSIVAGGANACVLHYVENNALLRDGDLLLIDAGCELDGYASDITRTFPVNGRFSPAQKDLYQLVLAAQLAAIAKVKPGNAWDKPHQAALKVLAQGFIDLGLCSGSVDGVLESGDYKRFYMHRTGHFLGLDVHDAGNVMVDGKPRKLAPGMTLTVEPGCYVRPADGVPEAFWNTGIRIEDDVAVTAQGGEVLSHAAPKSVAEIEEAMADRRPGKKTA